MSVVSKTPNVLPQPFNAFVGLRLECCLPWMEVVFDNKYGNAGKVSACFHTLVWAAEAYGIQAEAKSTRLLLH